MTTQYIGARYVPRHMGEWDADTQYGALDVVLYTDGNSYTAKQYPPKGTLPTDTKYWALSAQFNQQLANLNDTISLITDNVTALTSRVVYKSLAEYDYEDYSLAIKYHFDTTPDLPLYVPAGVFECKTSISIPQNAVIFGHGFDSVLKYTGTGVFITFSGYTFFSNLTFSGASNAEATLLKSTGYFVNIRNVSITTAKIGLQFNGFGSNFSNISFSGCATGLKITEYNQQATTITNFQSCSFTRNTLALDINPTDSTKFFIRNYDFSNITFENNTQNFSVCETGEAFYLSFRNIWLEGSTVKSKIKTLRVSMENVWKSNDAGYDYVNVPSFFQFSERNSYEPYCSSFGFIEPDGSGIKLTGLKKALNHLTLGDETIPTTKTVTKTAVLTAKSDGTILVNSGEFAVSKSGTSLVVTTTKRLLKAVVSVNCVGYTVPVITKFTPTNQDSVWSGFATFLGGTVEALAFQQQSQNVDNYMLCMQVMYQEE